MQRLRQQVQSEHPVLRRAEQDGVVFQQPCCLYDAVVGRQPRLHLRGEGHEAQRLRVEQPQVAVAGEDHQPVGEHLRVVELLVAQRHLALQFECRGVVDQYALALSDEYLV